MKASGTVPWAMRPDPRRRPRHGKRAGCSISSERLGKDSGAVCANAAREISGKPATGGEAQAHPAFSENLFAAHAEGIHTTIESACFAPREVAERAFCHVDPALLDMKHMDSSMTVYQGSIYVPQSRPPWRSWLPNEPDNWGLQSFCTGPLPFILTSST